MSIVNPYRREQRRKAFQAGLNATLAHRLNGADKPRCPHSGWCSTKAAWIRGAEMAARFADLVEAVKP
jgi:hypothetical protein